MYAILYDKIQIAKAVNVTVISLKEAPKGYKDFDKTSREKICDRSAWNNHELSRELCLLNNEQKEGG